MPTAPPGDPDFTGVEAALRRAAARARRQAAAVGGEVIVFRDGEVVREKPGRESISAPGSATRQVVDAFEERPVIGAGLDDLEDFLLKEHFRSRFPDRRSPDDRVSFLAARKLVVITDAGVVPTPLGLLLFAMQPEEHVPGAYVEIVSYRHNDPDGDAAVRDRIAGPLPEQIKRALTYLLVSPLTPIASRKGAYGRRDYPSYADRALREAIVNAVVHREYGIPGSPIVIRLFPDRIEFRNPGALCGGLAVEDLYAGRRSVRRNPLLASLLRGRRDDAAGGAIMEARGEGFLNLVRASERLSGRRPELEQIGEATKLTIFAAQHAAPSPGRGLPEPGPR